ATFSGARLRCSRKRVRSCRKSDRRSARQPRPRAAARAISWGVWPRRRVPAARARAGPPGPREARARERAPALAPLLAARGAARAAIRAAALRATVVRAVALATVARAAPAAVAGAPAPAEAAPPGVDQKGAAHPAAALAAGAPRPETSPGLQPA